MRVNYIGAIIYRETLCKNVSHRDEPRCYHASLANKAGTPMKGYILLRLTRLGVNDLGLSYCLITVVGGDSDSDSGPCLFFVYIFDFNLLSTVYLDLLTPDTQLRYDNGRH